MLNFASCTAICIFLGHKWYWFFSAPRHSFNFYYSAEWSKQKWFCHKYLLKFERLYYLPSFFRVLAQTVFKNHKICKIALWFNYELKSSKNCNTWNSQILFASKSEIWTIFLQNFPPEQWNFFFLKVYRFIQCVVIVVLRTYIETWWTTYFRMGKRVYFVNSIPRSTSGFPI